MTVQPSQRFTRRNPCPVCGGGADLARGRGERCHGFAAEDGRFAHCSREERAGGLDPDTAGTYPHRLDGPCRCGITHGEGPPAPPGERRSMPGPARPSLPDRPVPAADLCPPGFREAQVYPWVDETGAVRFETVRYEHPTEHQMKKSGKPEKTFRVRRPVADRSGLYLPSRGDEPPIVFRKDRLAARPGEELHWVEGEAHALALERLGILATTTAGGAGGVRAYDPEELQRAARDRHLVLHADNDRDGEAYVDHLVRAVTPVASSVRVLRYEDLGVGGDVLDWIRAGGTADDLRRRIAETSPLKPPSEKEGARLIVTRLSDVAAKPIEWLWQDRLARGKLHLLGGDYGDGKSTLMAWLAATLSTGGAWPDGDQAPVATVLFLLLEDAIDDTLKPRLAIHGADEDRVFAVEAVAEGEGTRRVFNLERHLDLLREYIKSQVVDVLIIDPVSAFMQRSNRDGEGAVRDILSPLVDLGNELDVAIVALMHTGKPGVGTAGRKATQRLLGSTAFPAVARVVWMLAPTPDDPTRKVLAVTKSNLGLKPAPLEWSRALDRPITWHGPSDHDIDQLFDAIKPLPREEAKAWLREALADGSVPQRIVEARARELGISGATLKRAREDLGVASAKQPGVVNGPWLWTLPNTAPAPSGNGAHPSPIDESVVGASLPPRIATAPQRGQVPDDDGKALTPASGEPLHRMDNGVQDAHLPHTQVSVFEVSPTLVAADRPDSPRNPDGSGKMLTYRRGERLRSRGSDIEEAHPPLVQGELLRPPTPADWTEVRR
ncbi:MAG: AAA family ATPase [Chloroflexota bacterium]|nr:AAA family ATPase [Chloroflexota bacterium]